MNEKHLYILLKVIYNDSNVKQLTSEGMTFSRIAELTSDSIKAGYIHHSIERITLSKKGLEKFIELELKFKKINKDEWIEKDLKSKISKLDKNTLFLPRQNELTF